MKVLPLLLLILLSTVVLAEETSPTPEQEIDYNTLESDWSATGLLSHETAPLGLIVLALLVFGFILDKFVK